jgi:nicotinate-nucleotide pyrophosphorylase
MSSQSRASRVQQESGASGEIAAACDLTTQWSVCDGLVSEANTVSRAHGVVAGLQLVDLVMRHIDPASVLSLYLAYGGFRIARRAVQPSRRGRAAYLVIPSQTSPDGSP